AGSGDGIGAKAAEFTVKLGFQIKKNGERYCGHDGHHHDGEQRGKRPVAAHPCGFYHQAHQQGGAVHASPRSTTAGSKRMALRTAPVLPANATASPAKITMGSTTG